MSKTNIKAAWKPAPGWFRAVHVARDAEAIYKDLVDDNERRAARGLPTFEPSYELAWKVAENINPPIPAASPHSPSADERAQVLENLYPN